MVTMYLKERSIDLTLNERKQYCHKVKIELKLRTLQKIENFIALFFRSQFLLQETFEKTVCKQKNNN